jgi:hypothetical protein
MANKSNYTPEMVEALVARYKELGNDGLEQLAEEFNKPVRSIRSKLCNEKVYVASPKTTHKKEGPTKKELLRDLEAKNFDTTGFEAATKEALHRLLGIVSN